MHGLEDSARLHVLHHGARDCTPRLYCPAMIIIEIQLIRRLVVYDGAGPQERWSAEFPDGNRAEKRFGLGCLGCGRGEVENVVTRIANFAGASSQTRERRGKAH